MKRYLNVVLPTAVAVVFSAFLMFHGERVARASVSAPLTIYEDLTASNAMSANWIPLNGACLTASSRASGPSLVPGCTNAAFHYYSDKGSTLVGGASGTLPDADGYGALRLTNGDTSAGTNGNNQTGAVLYASSFPTTQGVLVTWTSVAYGGNNYNNTGADGITFFLTDGSVAASYNQSWDSASAPNIGAYGGSLGYSCSNSNDPAQGLIGAYVGVGIDEFGNFGNGNDGSSANDNTDTGPTNAVSGTSAPFFQANRISVRGAGSTNWTYLANSATTKKWYPTSGPKDGSNMTAAMHNTCSTGYLWNFTNGTLTDSASSSIAKGHQTHEKLAYNYPLLAFNDLGASIPLANQQAISTPKRNDAKPITFALRITSAGLMTLTYSYNGGSAQPVLNGFNIKAKNGPLPASFRFGFSAGTGGGSNVHEITCFKAEPGDISGSTAGTNVQSAKVQSSSQVYLAFYNATNWWGSLTAQDLTYTAAAGSAPETLTVSAVAKWDGGCVLTSGPCVTTSATTAVAQGSGSRVMLAGNGTTVATSSPGVAFKVSGLTTAQLTALGDTSASPLHVNYLRGDRSQEVSNGGSFRDRTSVLGDIIDSSPVWVGPPQSPYASSWVDKLYASAVNAEGSTYATFMNGTASNRQNVVYVGADDGFLHGFRAGLFTSSGFASATNDGQEVIAFMPNQVLNTIHSSTAALDYSNIAYSHNFFVDAAPGTGDLYYNSGWHTWLVGGLGAGGQASGPVADSTTAESGSVFALDVTDPSTFTEANAASVVKADWNKGWFQANSCKISGTSSACADFLGATYGTPAIRRLHDGTWGVLFGNGLNSTSGVAGMFIIHIDSAGAQSAQFIKAGTAGASSSPRNGIAYVTPVDLDGDHITDFVYAGDMNGNLWRFDLTSSTSSSWSTASVPMFTTAASQPITTRVVAGSVPAIGYAGNPRLIVAFGTGQKLPQTLTSAEAYLTTQQSLYGVWDTKLSAAFNSQYQTYSSAPATITASTGPLVTRTMVTDATGTYRTVASTPTMCWAGQTATWDCSAASSVNYGWKLDLAPASAASGATTNPEQVIYNPAIIEGDFVVNTIIPTPATVLTCKPSSSGGFTMAVNLGTGAGNPAPFFKTPTTGLFDTPYIAGISTNATGTSSLVVTDSGNFYLAYQKNDGTGATVRIGPSPGSGTRLTWTRVR